MRFEVFHYTPSDDFIIRGQVCVCALTGKKEIYSVQFLNLKTGIIQEVIAAQKFEHKHEKISQENQHKESDEDKT
ncbi:MAG: hypothetical protein SFW66_08955 [Gammaproteobacteria bacterium]|nr:hypothetical protein [Gammaproteobacteria bacterium]